MRKRPGSQPFTSQNGGWTPPGEARRSDASYRFALPNGRGIGSGDSRQHGEWYDCGHKGFPLGSVVRRDSLAPFPSDLRAGVWGQRKAEVVWTYACHGNNRHDGLKGEREHALDNLCNSAGSMAIRTGHVVHVWRLRSHLAGPCCGRPGYPVDSRTQGRLTGAGPIVEATTNRS